MLNRYHLLGAAACIAACAVATPASAAVVVLGNSDARMCYEAADSPMMPIGRDVRRCDEALLHETLTAYETVATYVNRGILQLRRGGVEAAIGDFDRAIAMDANQPEAYLNKGAALLRRENAAEAMSLFTMALERNTTRPALAHYGRAIANETLGHLNAAYRDYTAASQIAPNWNEPRAELTRFRVISR
jgi:tetratricopeptide (TPR) repeat protein